MKKCRVFTESTPVIVINDDEYCKVDLYIEGMKLEKGVAYIRGDYVYVYYGKLPNNETPKPGVYKKGNDYVFIEPDESKKDRYSVDRVYELSTSAIFDLIESNKSDFVQPEDIEIINNNSEIYTPTIKDNDDFLKYVIKQVILDKKINLRNYKGRFNNEYALNNMKSGLNKSTKMTVPNFIKWAEVLGIDWELSVWDNGTDTINPLNRKITISSKDI